MIDTYFKQYFWSFHLLVLALAGYLCAHAANVWIREALRLPPTAVGAAITEKGPEDNTKKSIVATSAFLERNVFGAEREDLTPEPEATEGPEGPAAPGPNAIDASGKVDFSNCEKSTLRATLVATIYAEEDHDESLAVFVDPSKNDAETYRIKDKVLDQAEIIAVRWRNVYVNNGGKCESFTIEDDEATESTAKETVAIAPPVKNDGSPPKMELGKGIEKMSDNEYQIPRGEIDNVLGNLNVIATQARIVPSFRNGKANGFKLFSIRPGSLYSKIGIQNGDVIQKINGYEINSPDKALEIYSKLKDAETITVDLVRRGRSKTMSYGIR